MDFENLFSKPPNPALGKRPASDSEERIDDEIDDTEIEETQEEKVKWKGKLECEQIPKKSRHFGNSVSSKNLSYRKSRSKDYDVYSDNDNCSQESEDTFAKELQQYIQAKEMAKAAQSLCPEESLKKDVTKGTQKAVKQKNKNLKAVHKNGKQKKMKRKWPGTGDKGSNALQKNSGSQEQDGKPSEKKQHVRMSQEFINQHTVERKGKQICKYFLERKCIKGDQCKFDHDAEIEKKKEMCKFYVQGYCTRGENCLYLHNEYPCKFYHTGTKCYQGDYCKFSHAPLTAETQELLAKVLDTEKKSS
ncbi:PREDICTED: zinc finger CCCH domain-containing protein 8 [Condylura cristata]|uniref:zinc finger CCCH domain-containing protein 8 n=1 Tax=Condylura cristata TaxID=143302 RepID=UPI00033457F3|nr:PREDICTED: zinc finger CCCH domain-containing protein 8 [Condylura cristata]XP_012583054.1 PREDICTED: zinc finger CCCH domain-containing protein 8 [Condylura cristata]XP_012583055.1 PREDICTED: zinc finger CCCH domain-containing protein 8 [Condylura cristata]